MKIIGALFKLHWKCDDMNPKRMNWYDGAAYIALTIVSLGLYLAVCTSD